MQNLPEIPETPKILELRKRFSEAKKKDLREGKNDNFFAFLDTVQVECSRKVAEICSVQPPTPQLRLCLDAEFQEFQKLFGGMKDSLAFIDHRTHTVYFNFERQAQFSTSGFVSNLAVSFIEELLHSAFPQKEEVEIVVKAFDVIEDYLGIKLDDAYKKQSLARARESQ